MANVITGNLNAGDARFAIVAARWNDFITTRLVDGAVDAIVRHGGANDRIQVVWVPGSFEVPLATQRLAASRQYNGLICVGCLIRGQTPHFDYIAAEAAKGIAGASLKFDVPVGFGIVTADTLEQAIDRAGGKHGNKGAEAALAVIEMVNLLSVLPK